MAKEEIIGMTVKKSENFSEWYTEVVLKSKLADYAAIQGCIVFMPYSYEIWELLQAHFNKEIKKTGHKNAYFPLFIPEKFLHKEAEHFKGFVPEVAWVEKREDTEEKFAVRPTSETIIMDSYSKWIHSYRDLPVLINQWCNVVRWEIKATKPFLRTREFLWQEGHTVHRTMKEAEKEVSWALDTYKKMVEALLAIPVLDGKKSEAEKFAGALYTTTIEAMMPDGKALQMATSHNFGENFSKAFEIKFIDDDEKEKHPMTTSWGFSTRVLGALIMIHGDDKGLILPPKIAPVQLVVIPIVFDKTKKKVLAEAKKLAAEMSEFRTKLDDRDNYSPGWKYNHWELKGVPIRVEIGPKDIEKKQVVLVRRDTGEKIFVKRTVLKKKVTELLEKIQSDMFKSAQKNLRQNIHEIKNFGEFKKTIESKRGFLKTNWCGEKSCEIDVKDKTTATVRLLSFKEKAKGKCFHCGKAAKEVAYFAKAY